MSSESTIIPPNDPLKKYPTLCLSASQIDCISNGLAKDLKTQSMVQPSFPAKKILDVCEKLSQSYTVFKLFGFCKFEFNFAESGFRWSKMKKTFTRKGVSNILQDFVPLCTQVWSISLLHFNTRIIYSNVSTKKNKKFF